MRFTWLGWRDEESLAVQGMFMGDQKEEQVEEQVEGEQQSHLQSASRVTPSPSSRPHRA